MHPRKGLLFLAGIWQVKNSEFNSGQTSVLSYKSRVWPRMTHGSNWPTVLFCK